MRVTAAHVRQTALTVGLGLLAFAAMRAADQVIGHASPFTPGLVSLIVMALWILLLRRYGPHDALDPRRRQKWFFSTIAAGTALALLGVAVTTWIAWTHARPGVSCPASVRAQPVALANGASGHLDGCDR
jgi:hypothetical protein